MTHPCPGEFACMQHDKAFKAVGHLQENPKPVTRSLQAYQQKLKKVWITSSFGTQQLVPASVIKLCYHLNQH